LDAPIKRHFVASGGDYLWNGAINKGSHISGSENVELLEFENALAEISSAFVRATADQISPQIEHWLQRIVLALDIDRATMGQLNATDGRLYATHRWARPGIVPIPEALSAVEVLPWLTNRLLAGETVVVDDVEDLPPEAAKDLEFARTVQCKSSVAVPLRIGGVVTGAVTFDAVIHAHTWSKQTVQRLRLIAEVFGNALERARAVAEIRQLRNEMGQTSRMAMMGELTASLAHELNQPLGAILNNAQAARRFLVAKKPDLGEVEAAIEEIICDNSRAVQTMSNVRALFRRDQIEMSPVDPRQILLEAKRALTVEAASKGISLDLNLPNSLPIVVGNRAQLLEVLMNLVTNAFDSICDEGDGPRVVNLSARDLEDGRIQMAVRDWGKGIDAETMPRLFDNFFTTKAKGMGIGLRIARSIVQNHGGQIWATNNADQGATLAFELPVKEDAEDQK
jgi:signal transduction histidine kinase